MPNQATFGLNKQFGTPLQALQYSNKPKENRPEKSSPVQLHKRDASTQTMHSIDQLETCLLTLPESERLPAVTKLLQIETQLVFLLQFLMTFWPSLFVQ